MRKSSLVFLSVIALNAVLLAQSQAFAQTCMTEDLLMVYEPQGASAHKQVNRKAKREVVHQAVKSGNAQVQKPVDLTGTKITHAHTN